MSVCSWIRQTSKNVYEKATPSLPHYWGSQPNILWTTAPILLPIDALQCCGMQLDWTECKNLNNPVSISKIQSTPKSGRGEFEKMHRHCLEIQTIIPTTSIPAQKENSTSLFNWVWRTHFEMVKIIQLVV